VVTVSLGFVVLCRRSFQYQAKRFAGKKVSHIMSYFMSIENYYYYYNRFTALWILSGLPGWASTRKVKRKPIWISWSKRQWVAVGSAGPYAYLHLAQTEVKP